MPAQDSEQRRSRTAFWLNWSLAVLTVPAAGLIVLYALGMLVSFAACSDAPCHRQVPGDLGLGILMFAAPVVSALTIAASFFAAKHRRGFLVPLCAWVLLAADAIALVLLVRH
ncbi:MAG: hypothetical protein JO236_10905 [Mycobacterium sp.]|nr:hypothetical protein [Mycobacterium sp.]